MDEASGVPCQHKGYANSDARRRHVSTQFFFLQPRVKGKVARKNENGAGMRLLRVRFLRAPPVSVGKAGVRFVVALSDEHGHLVADSSGLVVECWASSSPRSKKELLKCEEIVRGQQWRASIDWEMARRIAENGAIEFGASCVGCQSLDAIGVRSGPISVHDDLSCAPTPLLRHYRDFSFGSVHASIIEDFGAA